MKNQIVTAGIRLTRKCNMRCNYCNIQSIKTNDLSLDEWKIALKNIKDLGVNDVVLLGGEPTMYSDIIKLIDFIVNDLKIRCSLTTNANNNFEIIKIIIDTGLTSLGVSIDNLDFKKSISPLKSINGLKLIDYIKENCKKYNIVCYTVLSKNNVDSVLELIKYIDKKNVYTYILPFHWGNEGTFEHRKDNAKYAFITEEEVKKYKKTIDNIILLKEQGYKIKNSKEFLETSKKYIKKLNWKCSGLSELRIDSDGKIVCCCDKVGNVNKNYDIFNLKDNLEEFYKMREQDSNNCFGCLWPSSFESELLKNRN